MIELTVALPIWNSKKIAWLALESLCNQKNITFEWELIIMEEYQNSFGIDGVKKYVDRLKKVGCVSVKYVPLDYKIGLPQKWVQMANMASETSQAYVFHAADDYPEPNKLYTAYNAIKNGHDWVAYKEYLLYDINTGSNVMFDADSVNWLPGNLIGTRTELVKVLPESFITKGVDKWLFNSINPQNIYYDTSFNWMQGFCTDGLNNISVDRKRNFQNPEPPFFKTELKAQDILNVDLSPKIDVKSHNVEFGYELISALPYAYSLYKKGLLGETTSAIDTECLYFFSKKHNIDKTQRGWDNMQAAKYLPNIKIHRPSLDWEHFEAPPLKEHYKNDRFKFKKPIVCICNRINVEWGKGVINYFDYDCLERLFKMLHKDYQIVYFNIEGKKEFYDGAEPVSINEGELVRKYGIHIADLSKKNKDLSFNTLQLMIMANCKNFITMNGGYSILASYFGGTNIIYSKECREIEDKNNSFYRWYNKFGGSRIEHVNNYKDLFFRVEDIMVKKSPLINIIVRSHNRPDNFKATYNSIKKQTYKNTQIIAGADNEETEQYLIPYKCRQVRYAPNADKGVKGEGYGIYFPFNHYINVLKNEITDGWFMGLDDDDMFMKKTAIETIVGNIKDEDSLLIWRVDLGTIIPTDANFGKNIVSGDISGIGFMCHIKHIKDYVYEPYRRSDYRIIKHLSEKLNVIWIDEVLTGSQNKQCNYGREVKQLKQLA